MLEGTADSKRTRSSTISVDLLGYKDAWLAWCAQQCTTSSHAFRSIVKRLTEHPAHPERVLRSTGPAEPSAQRISARLTASELAEVNRRAAAEHMKPAGWLVGLIRSHLTHEPQFGQEELAALTQSTAALRALGRNLNQVAKALNTSPHERLLYKVELVEELDRAVKSHAETVSRFIAANIERWRIQ
jgi:hypothetical protein